MNPYQDILVLVKALKSKDKSAFAYLYDNYSAALYGIVLKIVDDEEDANDVLQEAFINIWKSIDTFDEKRGTTLFTWMLNIARNKAIDRLRQKNRSTVNQKEHSIVSINNPHLNVSHIKTDTIGLKPIINKLKQEYQEIIELHYFKGLTHQEITEITQLPLGTVKTRIRSAITELKQVFGT